MTATDHAAPGAGAPHARAVLLDAAALTRCRRRIHLDHDPAAAELPRALPDPSGEQRMADAAAHRQVVAQRVAAAVGPSWVAVPPGPEPARIAATAAAVEAGAAVIGGAVLPPAQGRRGNAELLVRLPGGGYVPVIVVRHRISDPGEGAVTSPLTQPWPSAAAVDPTRRVRTQSRDLLRLAHLHRMLESLGWAPRPALEHATLAGIIGLDADVVVWHDLAGGLWPGSPSTLAEYDTRFLDRLAVAGAASSGGPPLAQPSRVMECRRCPFWATCEAELVAVDDVSLVVRGETATALRAIGVTTIHGLAALEPAPEPPIPLPGPLWADTIALARAWQRGLSVVRRVPSVPVLRADVEVDVDMESFGESGAYMWGTFLSHPGGRREGDEPEGYRAFVTWDPLPTVDEARSFAQFWSWFTGVRERAVASGRSFAAYCYNEQAENRWLLDSARRFEGLPGIPPLAEVEAFIADPCWVDIYALVDQWFLCARGKGLKRIAPAAGFGWHDPEAGGENSMRWYRAAVGLDGGPPALDQRERLLTYNADDVRATHAVRNWMSSPAIGEVPLAAEL